MDETTLKLIFTVITAIICALIVPLHIIPVFLRGRVARIISFVCIGLHVPLMPAMLFGGFDIEVMILTYTASAFLHALTRYILYELAKRKSGKSDKAGTDGCTEEVSE